MEDWFPKVDCRDAETNRFHIIMEEKLKVLHEESSIRTFELRYEVFFWNVTHSIAMDNGEQLFWTMIYFEKSEKS